MKSFVLFGLLACFSPVVLGAATNKTIWEVATETAELSDLVHLLNGTKYVAALSDSNSSLTLFAPSNEAFKGLNLTNLSVAVTYHLLGAKVNSSELKVGLQFPETLDNKLPIEINKDEGGVQLVFGLGDQAKVTTADVEASNGIVHIIDKILEAPADNVKTLTEAGMTEVLKAVVAANLTIPPSATLFLPTDKPFNESSFDAMDAGSKSSTLLYHVVPGQHYSKDLKDGMKLKTALGDELLVKISGDKVTVGGVEVSGPLNVITDSGNVVHTISGVIRVPYSPARGLVDNLALQADTTTMASVLKDPRYAPLVGGLNNHTFFCPNNDAITAANISLDNKDAVSAVLVYHFTKTGMLRAENLTAIAFPETLLTDKKYVNLGDSSQVFQVTKNDNVVKVNTAKVTKANLESSDKILTHVIDELLSIPKDIVTVVNETGLTTLLDQVIRTNLTKLVSTSAAITILAPNNAGFAAFSSNLSTVNVTDVQHVLEDHAFPLFYSTALKNGTNITSLGGKTYNITMVDGELTVDGAKILTANLLVENGAVHVIDRVLGGPAPKPDTPSKGKGVSPGVVVGIVIGVLAGVAIVGYCCFKSSNEEDGYKPM